MNILPERKQGCNSVFQVFASIIKSVRHWEPCEAWQGNLLPTRQPDCAGDCFDPYNDGKIKKTISYSYTPLLPSKIL